MPNAPQYKNRSSTLADNTWWYHGTDSDTLKYVKEGGLRTGDGVTVSGYGSSRTVDWPRIWFGQNAKTAEQFAGRRIDLLGDFLGEDAAGMTRMELMELWEIEGEETRARELSDKYGEARQAYKAKVRPIVIRMRKKDDPPECLKHEMGGTTGRGENPEDIWAMTLVGCTVPPELLQWCDPDNLPAKPSGDYNDTDTK